MIDFYHYKYTTPLPGAVAEESGIGNVRTLQRRIQEVVGMTPVEYRRMLTRDL